MKPSFLRPVARRAAGFYFPRPGNLLLVHGAREGKISVYATTDNLNQEQQEAFIQYLCAEDFVSGDDKPSDGFHGRGLDPEKPPVRWIVDPSWPAADAAYALHVQRLCWCVAGTMMVWLVLMVVLVCY